MTQPHELLVQKKSGCGGATLLVFYVFCMISNVCVSSDFNATDQSHNNEGASQKTGTATSKAEPVFNDPIQPLMILWKMNLL